MTAVNGTTTVNGKWSVYDQGNGVGTAAKAAKDTLTLETETTAVQEINQARRNAVGGDSVLAVTQPPQGVRYKRMLRLGAKGMEEIK